MSPPMAADDVSADAEMMLFAIAHNDAMFALMCPQAHIIAAGSIIREAHIICPAGQTSLKKAAHGLLFSRRHPESNRGIKVLQTSALPLGYGADNKSRTRLSPVREERITGIEPATSTLARSRSTK